jgi:hypothetical protein
VLRRNVLSPVLLNIYIEKALMSKKNIKHGIEDSGKLNFSFKGLKMKISQHFQLACYL